MFGAKKHDIEITVEGMSCMHCVKHVEDALNAIPGVKAEVDLKKKTAFADLTQPVEDAALKAAINGAGYKATAVNRSR
jgi:copper chaperone CopZ